MLCRRLLTNPARLTCTTGQPSLQSLKSARRSGARGQAYVATLPRADSVRSKLGTRAGSLFRRCVKCLRPPHSKNPPHGRGATGLKKSSSHHYRTIWTAQRSHRLAPRSHRPRTTRTIWTVRHYRTIAPSLYRDGRRCEVRESRNGSERAGNSSGS